MTRARPHARRQATCGVNHAEKRPDDERDPVEEEPLVDGALDRIADEDADDERSDRRELAIDATARGGRP